MESEKYTITFRSKRCGVFYHYKHKNLKIVLAVAAY